MPEQAFTFLSELVLLSLFEKHSALAHKTVFVGVEQNGV